ncbi:MAG: putative toxin-antitoxin system toxin component, PIN family [Thermodesulfobacteriota bacterium]
MKVVLDTNVYISAILFGGNCEEILRLSGQGSYELVISKNIIAEIEGVLKDKFTWSRKQISETLSYIRNIATVINPEISLSVIRVDPSDNKIIECAAVAGANYIVTGDRTHLLPLKEYKGIKIMSPAEFLSL